MSSEWAQGSTSFSEWAQGSTHGGQPKKSLVNNPLMCVDMSRQEQCKQFTKLRMHTLCHVHVITHCTFALCNAHATNVRLFRGV